MYNTLYIEILKYLGNQMIKGKIGFRTISEHMVLFVDD